MRVDNEKGDHEPAKDKKAQGGKKEAKKPHKHLHEIRSVQAEDGSIVHHHTYKTKKEDHHTEPERSNVATSENAEEAGEHVREQFAMNQGAQQPEPGGEGEEEAGEGAPGAAAPEPGEGE